MKKVFGFYFNNLVDYISKSKLNAIYFSINYFLFVYIIIFTVKYNINTIYLDTIDINLTINGIKTNITGDILTILKDTFGETAVFLVGARLAYLIIAKNPTLGYFPKIGIILTGGSGSMLSYKIIDRNMTSPHFSKIIVSNEIGFDSLKLSTTANYDIPKHPVLDLLFGIL